MIAYKLIDDEAEKLIGFAILIKPAEMLAAITAVCGLPDIVFKPGKFVGSRAADIATWSEPEAADQKLRAARIDEAMLVTATDDQLLVPRRDPCVAEVAKYEVFARNAHIFLPVRNEVVKRSLDG